MVAVKKLLVKYFVTNTIKRMVPHLVFLYLLYFSIYQE